MKTKFQSRFLLFNFKLLQIIYSSENCFLPYYSLSVDKWIFLFEEWLMFYFQDIYIFCAWIQKQKRFWLSTHWIQLQTSKYLISSLAGHMWPDIYIIQLLVYVQNGCFAKKTLKVFLIFWTKYIYIYIYIYIYKIMALFMDGVQLPQG